METATAWAYGLDFSGVDAPGFVLPARGDAPLTVHIRHRDDVPTGALPGIGEDTALLQLGEVSLLMDRRRALAEICSPHPIPPDVLVHPYLGGPGGVFSHWLGRETFHAGAFVAGEGAWVVAGDREAGKSTLLATLAALGAPILCDDLVVVEDGHVYAGPRCIDLRPSAAERFRERTDLVPSRIGSRFRVALGSAPHRSPIAGWVLLGWGEDATIRRIPPFERIERIARRRSLYQPPADPAVLVEFAALPMLEVRRPAGWTLLEETAERPPS